MRLDVADTEESRRAAAGRYIAAAPIVADLLQPIAGQLGVSDDVRQRFFEVLREEVIEGTILTALVKHLTVHELEAMAVFYSSPEWRSASRKLPAVLQQAGPALREEIQRAAREALKAR